MTNEGAKLVHLSLVANSIKNRLEREIEAKLQRKFLSRMDLNVLVLPRHLLLKDALSQEV